MKKIFIIFAFLLSAFSAFADGVSANDVTLKNDETTSLDISLDNALEDIVGLQFNLNLPEGITPMMEGDKVVITPTNRLSGSYSLRGKRMADGSYLFTLLSNDRIPIAGNSGALFSIILENSASLADGSYEAVISDVTMTDLSGNEQTAANTSSSIVIVHSYKLTYYVDGAKYKEMTYDYGSVITPESEPTKEGHTFSGWSEIPETMPAHDVDVNGSFIINKYTIKFVNEDGTVLQSSEVEYGITPVYSGTTPTKATTAEYSYTFTEWSPEIVAVTADATYTATYANIPNQYKLTYKVNGTIYKEYTLNYGDAITPESEPTKEGYTFSGWSEVPETMPAHNVTVTGSFTVNKYKLTYIVDDEIYDESEVEYGTTITPIDEPTKEGHTFSGWSEIPETMPAHDVVIVGTFTKDSLRGDANCDGVVTVSDIVATAGYILGTEPEAFSVEQADCDGNGTITVSDIVYMAQYILNGEWPTQAQVKAILRQNRWLVDE